MSKSKTVNNMQFVIMLVMVQDLEVDMICVYKVVVDHIPHWVIRMLFLVMVVFVAII